MEGIKNRENSTPDIPRRILELFLQETGKSKLPKEVHGRLEKALLEQGNLSESAIRAALFSDSNPL